MSAAPSWNTKQAEQHLRHTDDIMAELIERHGPCRLHERCGPPFEQLVVAIINQLISRQAARAIETRVRKLAPDFTPAAFTRITADRKSTRLNSSHVAISYAVFCLKKKTI